MLRRNQGEPSTTSSTGDLAHFKLVRRGYDVEQVDAFLLTQATAWSTELAQARQENVDLRAQLARRTQDAQAASLAVQDQAAVHPQPAQQTDVEIIARAETTAARIVAEADQQAQTRVRAALRAQEEVLNQRQENLDARYARTKAQYEEVLAALHAKVGELQETREALVGGLETIAAGGLAAVEGLENELPPADLSTPAELARQAQPALADATSGPQNKDDLEAALAAEIRAAADQASVEDEEEGEFDPLTPASTGIAAPALSDTTAAEAQIASAEDQLVDAEAHLASLAEQLVNAEPLAVSLEGDSTDLGDDQAEQPQQVDEAEPRGRVLVPPSILDEPPLGVGLSQPDADTEGFQAVDDGPESPSSADQEADVAADAESEETDTESVTTNDSTDEEPSEPAPANGQAQGADEPDDAPAEGTTNDDETGKTLEPVAATVDANWAARTVSSAADRGAVAAPSSLLGAGRPEADTAEHPVANSGSNGFSATSFQWNDPSS